MRRTLNTLCPMHVVVDPSGHLVHAGPTIEKVASGELRGRRFLEVFELRRPREIKTMEQLRREIGRKLHLRLRDGSRMSLIGVLLQEPGSDNFIVDLSFGISVIDAVKAYDLTSSDFSPTDLAMEMLYLVEAKSAAMAASRTLNTRLQGAMIAAEEQAFTDTLTGLKNRRALDHVLNRLSELRMDFAIMLLDLDYFKSVNDTLGHAAGDAVLLQVARALVEETRESDTVARVGGDEFVLIFQGKITQERLSEIAGRLIARLEEPIRIELETANISGSIGIIRSMDFPEADLAALMDQADVALYASKNAGRGCFTHYSHDLRNPSTLADTG